MRGTAVAVACLVLAACNQAFGIPSTILNDSAVVCRRRPDAGVRTDSRLLIR